MAVNRSHEPIVIEDFMGLFKRGDADSCPIDHFSQTDNLKAIESGFETRDGLGALLPGGGIRMYNYKMVSGESLIILRTGGDFYHALLDGSNTVYGPILSIPDATDFDIYVNNGLCYITPFKTFTDLNGVDYQKGLEGEFVYVYKGDGSAARKAAGAGPLGGNSGLVGYTTIVTNLGVVDQGIHILGVTAFDGVDESGGLGPEGMSVVIVDESDTEIVLNNVPLGDVGTTERRIYMTHAIDFPDWNPSGDIRDNYTYYLAFTIPDNTTTSCVVNIADADLIVPFVGGGALPTLTNSNMFARNSDTNGYCDLGLHVIGVVFETDTGYLTAPGPEFYAVQTFVNENKAIDVFNIPVSPDPFVTKRHLVSTKAIPNFNGNNIQSQFSYQLFFIPGGNIDDNTTTSATVSYYDSDLLEDASHLIDNFAEIPAGTSLTGYGGRMVLTTPFDFPSIAYASAPGEPEAIDQVDGLIEIPVDGNPITMAQEFREILYIFKRTRTYPVSDNGDVPATWAADKPLDLGAGCPVHGIAQVLDSGGVNVDFLLVCDFSGVMMFNGVFSRPELSYKIQDYWLDIDRNDFGQIQILNDTILQRIYIALPNRVILYADYSYGLNPQDIRWFPWSFVVQINTIALIRTNTLTIGSAALMPGVTL